jgi:hypothetical protein
MADHDRRFPRLASQHTLLVKKLDGEKLEEFAHTMTIARGGCSFISAEPLGAGSMLDLLMTVEHEVLHSRARVIYEHPHDDHYEVGVEFLNLDDLGAAKIESLFAKPVE